MYARKEGSIQILLVEVGDVVTEAVSEEVDAMLLDTVGVEVAGGEDVTVGVAGGVSVPLGV